MKTERVLGVDQEPSECEMIDAIGNSDLWSHLRETIAQRYDYEPELVNYGKKYGWTIRYRKSGKTLVSLFPEYSAFTAPVVPGKKESEKVPGLLDDLSPATRELIGSSQQLHDGTWFWIRVLDSSQVEDVKRLLAVKRTPRSATA